MHDIFLSDDVLSLLDSSDLPALTWFIMSYPFTLTILIMLLLFYTRFFPGVFNSDCFFFLLFNAHFKLFIGEKLERRI